MLVAQRAQAGEEAVRRGEIAAFALHRFDQDRRHFARRHAALEQHADVVEHRRALVVAGKQRAVRVRIRHVGDAGQRGREALLLGVLAGGERQRAEGAAVEAAEEPDEARPPGDVARQLQRAFHRLGAGLADEAHRRFAQRRHGGEAFAQPGHLLVPVVAGDVQEFRGGILHRLDHLRVRMAGGAHRDAGHEVEEAVAVHVPHLGAAAVRHHERVVARVRGRDHLGVAGDHRQRLRAGQGGLDVVRVRRGVHRDHPF